LGEATVQRKAFPSELIFSFHPVGYGRRGDTSVNRGKEQIRKYELGGNTNNFPPDTKEEKRAP